MTFTGKLLIFLIFIIAVSNYTVFANVQSFPSPLKQLKSGIAIQDIKCREGLTLVIKESNEYPSCIKPTNIGRFISHGWVTIEKFETTHSFMQHSDGIIQQQNNTSLIIKNNTKITETTTQILDGTPDCDSKIKDAYFSFINSLDKTRGVTVASNSYLVQKLIQENHLDTTISFYSTDANYTYNHATCNDFVFKSVDWLFPVRNSNNSFEEFVLVTEDPQLSKVINLTSYGWNEMVDIIYAHPYDLNYIYKLYQISLINGTVPQLASGGAPNPVLPVNFTASSTNLNSVKILFIGLSPDPLKVGDIPRFSLTWQNISDKPVYITKGCGVTPLGITILPSDNVISGIPVHHPLCSIRNYAINPNQIETDGASVDHSYGFFTIKKTGTLHVTLNLLLRHELDGKNDQTETIQFDINVTQ